MKLISANYTQSAYGNGVQKIEFDENNLNFIGNYAVVKAIVECNYIKPAVLGYNKPVTKLYNCEGVIKKDEEGKIRVAFIAKYTQDPEKYLMFLQGNERVYQYGPNDFIVKTNEVKNGTSTIKFVHLKVENENVQIVPDDIKDFKTTSIQNVAIVNNQFFYVPASKTIGTQFKYLRENSNKPGEFVVIDQVVLKETKENPYPIVDEIFFLMTMNRELTSKAYSLIEGNRELRLRAHHYPAIHDERLRQLEEKREEALVRMRTL